MKLRFLSTVLAVALIGGCASHTTPQPPVSPTPAVLPTLPPVSSAEPKPVPAPEPTPAPEPKSDGPQLTPDGTRVMLKGDVWELDVPVDTGWRVMQTNQYVLALMNPATRTIVIFDREDWVKSTADYAKAESEKAKSAGGTVASQRTVTLNGRQVIALEFKLQHSVVTTWVLTTGAEAFSLACGGQEKDAATNKPICEDLAAHLYIGKKP